MKEGQYAYTRPRKCQLYHPPT